MLARRVTSPSPPPFERAGSEPTPRAERDPGPIADPARPVRPPAATRGRLVRLGRWLVAIDEFREYRDLQRGYWARLREQPWVGTAVRWVVGDGRQLVLIFRVVLKLGLLFLALGLLAAMADNM